MPNNVNNKQLQWVPIPGELVVSNEDYEEVQTTYYYCPRIRKGDIGIILKPSIKFKPSDKSIKIFEVLIKGHVVVFASSNLRKYYGEEK